jgi:hypothetical protein
MASTTRLDIWQGEQQTQKTRFIPPDRRVAEVISQLIVFAVLTTNTLYFFIEESSGSTQRTAPLTPRKPKSGAITLVKSKKYGSLAQFATFKAGPSTVSDYPYHVVRCVFKSDPRHLTIVYLSPN